MLNFSSDSIDMGKIACFYLHDFTDFLKKTASVSDTTVLREENGEIEEAIMFIGGWSKTGYLTELHIFYPRLNKLGRWGNSVQLQAADMVTKRPILYQDNLYVLGRHHIHIIDLK